MTPGGMAADFALKHYQRETLLRLEAYLRRVRTDGARAAFAALTNTPDTPAAKRQTLTRRYNREVYQGDTTGLLIDSEHLRSLLPSRKSQKRPDHASHEAAYCYKSAAVGQPRSRTWAGCRSAQKDWIREILNS